MTSPARRPAVPAAGLVRASPRREPAVGLAAFAPAALLGLLEWAALVAPADDAAAWTMLAASLGAGAALIAAARLRTARARCAARLATLLALSAGTLLAAGVPARLLAPAGWGELAAGVGDGLDAMATTVVPYRGSDPWTRTTMMLGATGIAAIAVVVLCWPRGDRGRSASPILAAGILAALYAVPAGLVVDDRPALTGTMMAMALAALVVAGRVRGGRAGLTAAALLVAAAVGGASTPVLDAGRPWVDLQALTQAGGGVSYGWDHDYGPIDWPRDGREMLRVKAQAPAYWKAQVLETFDGIAWRDDPHGAGPEPAPDEDRGEPQWYQTIAVSVRGLSSPRFVTAGQTSRIFASSRRIVATADGGFATAGTPLDHGATYKARVYTPRPSQSQLAHASWDLGSRSPGWLTIELPHRIGDLPGQPNVVRFAPFGSGLVTTLHRPGVATEAGDWRAALRRTGLRRTFDLAERLRSEATSPYDYVRRVERRVMQGAIYSEHPRMTPNPLDTFLFDDRRGYCQHFSGAMALLLRMGGVPARVVVGFSPGVADAKDGTYVVRDLDAHSWVEAYFPRYGWVTFDPTPAASPAREQVDDEQATLGFGRDTQDAGQAAGIARIRGVGASGSGADGTRGSTAGGGPRTAILAGLALGAVAAIAGVVLLRRRHRLSSTGPVSVDPALAELERALRRVGRPPRDGQTLLELELGLADAPAAAGYVRALRRRRYAAGGGSRPSAAERRALRARLGAGLGLSGRLRSWWALPPRPGRG
ncbi:MAG: transglutaminase-like domain-containing protein [Solirubrobacteraceae bacterium]|nr:transglutaminase-like domain-containing protein [Solirubrobacteraceae bacterium]